MKKYLLVLFFFMIGCNGFNNSVLSNFESGDNGGFSNVDYQLTIQTGPYEGRLVVDQIRNSSIKVLIPVGFNNLIPLGNFSSSQWLVSGNVTQDQTGFKTIALDVPVSQVVQGVNAPIVTTLPNRDPLDFIVDGQAQHYSIPIGASGTVNLHLYFSAPYLLGVFIQTPFDLASANKYPVAQGNSVVQKGFFSTHPHRPPLNGGAFVFISLPQ